jgi:hypothetical protein
METAVLDLLLDITADTLIPMTTSLPLDSTELPHVPHVPLDEKQLSPRVELPSPMIPHVVPPPPLMPPNGTSSFLNPAGNATQDLLDASPLQTDTVPTTPVPKTKFPPIDHSTVSSAPSIPNLEDKVLCGPESNVSVPSY